MGVHRLPERMRPGQREIERAVELEDGPRYGLEAAAARWDRDMSVAGSPAPLLQSWAWADLQAAAGWRPTRLDIAGSGLVLVLTQQAGPLRWGYVPRGPVACTAGLLDTLVAWSRRAGLARLRVEPERTPDVCPLLASRGFRRTVDVQPSHTRIVKLGDDEALLASFRRTTRYNIRLAERIGVTVDEGAEAGELAKHVSATAARAGVNLPGRTYFEALLERLAGSRTFVARYRGESLCALLVALHDGRGYYLFSGSSGRMRNLKPMDLAMFRAMQYAARSGCRDYDLWGITTDNDRRHPWHGFSEFKRGFGGEVVEYAGTWDLRLSTAAELALEARDRALRAYRRWRSRPSTPPIPA